MELRCNSRILHGITDEDFIEVTCRSRRCGKEPGVVVLHKFNIKTGELVETLRFAEPVKETFNGTCCEGIALRNATDQGDPARG